MKVLLALLVLVTALDASGIYVAVWDDSGGRAEAKQFAASVSGEPAEVVPLSKWLDGWRPAGFEDSLL